MQPHHSVQSSGRHRIRTRAARSVAMLIQQPENHTIVSRWDVSVLIVVTIAHRSEAMQYLLTYSVVPNRGVPSVVGQPIGIYIPVMNIKHC